MTFYTLFNLSDLCLPKFSYKIKYTVWKYSCTRFRYDFWLVYSRWRSTHSRTMVKTWFFIRGNIYNGIKNVNHHINYDHRSLIKLILTGLKCKNNKLIWFTEQIDFRTQAWIDIETQHVLTLLYWNMIVGIAIIIREQIKRPFLNITIWCNVCCFYC